MISHPRKGVSNSIDEGANHGLMTSVFYSNQMSVCGMQISVKYSIQVIDYLS